MDMIDEAREITVKISTLIDEAARACNLVGAQVDAASQVMRRMNEDER